MALHSKQARKATASRESGSRVEWLAGRWRGARHTKPQQEQNGTQGLARRAAATGSKSQKEQRLKTAQQECRETGRRKQAVHKAAQSHRVTGSVMAVDTA